MTDVLITGGTGFFARGFVRRLLASNFSNRICIYSRGEFSQATMRSEFDDDPRLRWFIGDVRDKDRLTWAMKSCQIVVAAAALKRIETGFMNPTEMSRTNVDGAINTVDAAIRADAQKVVFLSSDKAFQPISAYGQSKALAESIFLNANNTRGASGPIFSAVRYGNIWNSTGSVVPTWRALIAKGAGSVPVTDPTCSRFFMRLGEACDLVLKTIQTMGGGELNIPDLPAYQLGDLVEAMGIKMVVTGLPAHEKQHESMSGDRCSKDARRMTIEELKLALSEV